MNKGLTIGTTVQCVTRQLRPAVLVLKQINNYILLDPCPVLTLHAAATPLTVNED